MGAPPAHPAARVVVIVQVGQSVAGVRGLGRLAEAVGADPLWAALFRTGGGGRVPRVRAAGRGGVSVGVRGVGCWPVRP
ncbi:hypothetical protein ACH4OY_19595 [Micromonospora rubida]|uniref:Uncharacterized protein n=1 Tax=Micromonospora rubida TaxID=2697657 RepID=A0ABW7SMD9_9ACTN